MRSSWKVADGSGRGPLACGAARRIRRESAVPEAVTRCPGSQACAAEERARTGVAEAARRDQDRAFRLDRTTHRAEGMDPQPEVPGAGADGNPGADQRQELLGLQDADGRS